jgi:hypothetical protein
MFSTTHYGPSDEAPFKADLFHTQRLNPAQERGGVRKKYQDLLEYQQKSAILLEEYHGQQAYRKARKVDDLMCHCICVVCLRNFQVDRLTSQGHCEYLIRQLKDPITLDGAKELIGFRSLNSANPTDCGKGFLDWLGDLKTDGAQTGIDNHLRTLTAMRDKRRQALT